jgi:signal transduction histidine kinase
MPTSSAQWFDTSGFTPHGYCFQWTPAVLGMHVISDVLIGLAYFLIPVGLYVLHRRRPDLDFGFLFITFGAFIAACGLTHWLAAWNLWHAEYWIEGIVKAVTAAISIPAAYALWKALPKIVSLPSHEALTRANGELQEANRELEAFTETASHDLRSPMHGVVLLLQATAETAAADLKPPDQRALARAISEIKRMSVVVDARLRLARIAREPLNRRDVDLTEIVGHVADRLRRVEPDARVALTVDRGLRINADPDLIDVLMENLLANAWKFTQYRPQRAIHVGRRVADGVEQIYVRDNGVGFDMAQAGHLFRPLERLHDAKQFPGSGIGLATAARIIARHGGTIGIASAPDAGTTVFFSVAATLAARRQA